ncbi:hypothetical protein ACH5RR_027656 [Cinchona calisaya]|uniref:Uncharacterized protein n=1 Tax=Cinchona calisaya TaxID=153742 RepID=A0ABD2YQK0_9GENT
MGRGRAPCCDKSKVKKGPWSPAEDLTLISFIRKQGHANWRALPKQAGLLRCGKSCRLRWINYLRPDVKRGNFTPEEEQTIINLHNALGNKWSKIASHFPGRTDNEIKNVWNTHLKKRSGLMINNVAGNDHETEEDEEEESSLLTSTNSSYSSSASSYNRPSPSSSSSCYTYQLINSDHNGPNVVDHDQNQDLFSTTSMVSVSGQKISQLIDHHEPITSHSSTTGATNNMENTSPQVEEVLKQETMSSLNIIDHNIIDANDAPEAQNTILKEEETNNQMAEDAVEIPLLLLEESSYDADFWNMLDGFDPPLPPPPNPPIVGGGSGSIHQDQSQPQQEEIEICSNLLGFEEDDHQEQVELNKWLRYLENELGLVGGN